MAMDQETSALRLIAEQGEEQEAYEKLVNSRGGSSRQHLIVPGSSSGGGGQVVAAAPGEQQSLLANASFGRRSGNLPRNYSTGDDGPSAGNLTRHSGGSAYEDSSRNARGGGPRIGDDRQSPTANKIAERGEDPPELNPAILGSARPTEEGEGGGVEGARGGGAANKSGARGMENSSSAENLRDIIEHVDYSHAYAGGGREAPQRNSFRHATPGPPLSGAAISSLPSRSSLSSSEMVGEWLSEIQDMRQQEKADRRHRREEAGELLPGDDSGDDSSDWSDGEGVVAHSRMHRLLAQGNQVAIGNQGFRKAAHDLNLDTDDLLDRLYMSSKEFDARNEAIESGEANYTGGGDSGGGIADSLIGGRHGGRGSPLPQSGGTAGYSYGGGRRLSARVEPRQSGGPGTLRPGGGSKAGSPAGKGYGGFPQGGRNSPSAPIESGAGVDEEVSRIVVVGSHPPSHPMRSQDHNNNHTSSHDIISQGNLSERSAIATSSVARNDDLVTNVSTARGRSSVPPSPHGNSSSKNKSAKFVSFAKRNKVEDVIVYEVENDVFIDIQYQRNKVGWLLLLLALVCDVSVAMLFLHTVLVERPPDSEDPVSYYSLAVWGAVWATGVHVVFAGLLWASSMVTTKQLRKGLKSKKALKAATLYGISFAMTIVVQIVTADEEQKRILPPTYLPTMNLDLFFMLLLRLLAKENTFFQEWIGALFVLIGYTVASWPIFERIIDRGFITFVGLNGGLLTLSGVESTWFFQIANCQVQGKSIVVTMLPAVIVELIIFILLAVAYEYDNLAQAFQVFLPGNIKIGLLLGSLTFATQIFYLSAARYLDVISMAGALAIKGTVLPYLVREFVFKKLPFFERNLLANCIETQCEIRLDGPEPEYPGYGYTLFVGTGITFIACIFLVVFSSVKRQFVARRIAFSPSRLRKPGDPAKMKAKKRAEREARRREEAEQSIRAATLAAGPDDNADGSGGIPSEDGDGGGGGGTSPPTVDGGLPRIDSDGGESMSSIDAGVDGGAIPRRTHNINTSQKTI